MRYFVTFKQGSTLTDKIMVFVDMTRNQVQDMIVEHYGISWNKIYTEPELATVLPQIYCKCDSHLVPFGTENEITVNGKQYKYPSGEITTTH